MIRGSETHHYSKKDAERQRRFHSINAGPSLHSGRQRGFRSLFDPEDGAALAVVQASVRQEQVRGILRVQLLHAEGC